MSRLCALCCLPSVKMPSASADSPDLDFDYSRYHKTLIQKLWKSSFEVLTKSPRLRQFPLRIPQRPIHITYEYLNKRLPYDIIWNILTAVSQEHVFPYINSKVIALAIHKEHRQWTTHMSDSLVTCVSRILRILLQLRAFFEFGVFFGRKSIKRCQFEFEHQLEASL